MAIDVENNEADYRLRIITSTTKLRVKAPAHNIWSSR